MKIAVKKSARALVQSPGKSKDEQQSSAWLLRLWTAGYYLTTRVGREDKRLWNLHPGMVPWPCLSLFWLQPAREIFEPARISEELRAEPSRLGC